MIVIIKTKSRPAANKAGRLPRKGQPPIFYHPAKGKSAMKSNTILAIVVIVFAVAAYAYLHGFAQMMTSVHF